MCNPDREINVSGTSKCDFNFNFNCDFKFNCHFKACRKST